MASADWAQLPNDLIAQIANSVEVIEDFIAFRAVCTSWRIAATKENFDVFSPQVPLLMLADHKDNDYVGFYSLSKKKVSRIFLPEARERDWFPSEGWLCTVKSDTGEMNLLHPFSRTQIQLPSREDLKASIGCTYCWGYMQKVVLSVNPSITSDYALVVQYSLHADSNFLVSWQPGDLGWTKINFNESKRIVSFIFSKGQYYILTRLGEVWVLDVARPSIVNPRLLVKLNVFDFSQYKVQFDLVEVHGILLVVKKKKKKKKKFEVSELDLIKGELKGKIKTLGDSTTFLGNKGASKSIDSSKFTGVNPNRIYSVEDYYGKSVTYLRAYNLEDGNIEFFYHIRGHVSPTWITPSF